jgi:hypothetical protein
VCAFDGDTLRLFNQRFGCERGIAVEAYTSLFDSIREVDLVPTRNSYHANGRMVEFYYVAH